ncbi:MAG: zinc-binding dehydrogenase [Acidobacteria bacterium]|nr:zinc-binding dehydrogenase [Acidobacteriota bacterium]
MLERRRLPRGAIRAAVLTAWERPLELREYPAIERIGPGEALVRVEMAGICGTDVHLWRGQLPIPLPVILGHESVGAIEQLGAGLDHDWRKNPLSPGDRVTWASSIVCGECFYCRLKRQPTRCLKRRAYGISYCADEPPHLGGGYAEKILLRAGTAIFRIPAGLATESVIGAGCALVTAIHGLERVPVGWGDVVVIQGAGPVGLAALAVSRQCGAARVIAIGGPPHRLELARKFGASAVIDIAQAPDPAERIRLAVQETGGYGADVVIECVGHPAAVREGVEMCRDGGRYLVLGQYGNAGEVLFNPHVITRKQLQITGSWGFEPRHLDRALSLLAGSGWGELFAQEVSDRFPLDQADAALETVREWRSAKAVLTPNGDRG